MKMHANSQEWCPEDGSPENDLWLIALKGLRPELGVDAPFVSYVKDRARGISWSQILDDYRRAHPNEDVGYDRLVDGPDALIPQEYMDQLEGALGLLEGEEMRRQAEQLMADIKAGLKHRSHYRIGVSLQAEARQQEVLNASDTPWTLREFVHALVAARDRDRGADEAVLVRDAMDRLFEEALGGTPEQELVIRRAIGETAVMTPDPKVLVQDEHPSVN